MLCNVRAGGEWQGLCVSYCGIGTCAPPCCAMIFRSEAKIEKICLILRSMEDGFEKYGFPDGKRYNSFVGYFKRKYGERLQKIVLDAGFTCPNRDGKVGRGGCTYCDNAAFHPSYSTAGKASASRWMKVSNSIRSAIARPSIISLISSHFQIHTHHWEG